MNFLNSVRDKTPVFGQRGVEQILCDSGKYHAGRTHQNLEKRLHHRKDDLTKALNSNASFDSALSSHVFENRSHKILFEESALMTAMT